MRERFGVARAAVVENGVDVEYFTPQRDVDRDPAKLLFLKPGQKRIYQDVIEAMDVAKGAGIQIIGFTPKEAYR